MEDVNVIVNSSGVIIEAPLSDEYLEKLNEEASIYMNYEIPEVKLGGNPPSGKENRKLGEC